MLIVSESPQNYKNIAECNQLTDVGREGGVRICRGGTGILCEHHSIPIQQEWFYTTKNGKYKNAFTMYFSIKKNLSPNLSGYSCDMSYTGSIVYGDDN
jgi:hypothetical protein